LVTSRRSVRRRRKRRARPADPSLPSGAGYPFAMTRRAVTLFSGTLLLVALVLLSGRARRDNTCVELVPGPTFNPLRSSDGKQLTTITGAPSSTSAGQLRMLTVGEIDDVNVFDIVKGWLDPSNAVVPAEIINPPGQTQQQINQQETDQFQQSQNSAITV